MFPSTQNQLKGTRSLKTFPNSRSYRLKIKFRPWPDSTRFRTDFNLKKKLNVKRRKGTHTFKASIRLGMCEAQWNQVTYGFAWYGTKITSDFDWNLQKSMLVVIIEYAEVTLQFPSTHGVYLYVNKRLIWLNTSVWCSFSLSLRLPPLFHSSLCSLVVAGKLPFLWGCFSQSNFRALKMVYH